jgi:hypothetical protein
LVIISYTTGLSFALERIGPLAAIIIIVFYLLVLYLFALPNIPENPFASIYSESLIKTTCQHLLLLVGFDTLIYRKYYDTPPILVGHHPSIRYFAYFIAKCVLARKTANKLSSYDLAFISAALRQDRTYNLGALIAFHLAANCEKGGVCGGLIASRLLALHGVAPHDLDIQFPIERLDLNSMIHHKFVSSQDWLGNLSYEITFLKKSAWGVVKTDRLVHLPALLFKLDGRNGWSLTEDELDAYMEEHPHHVHEGGKGTEDNSVQPSSKWEFPYQQSYFDQGHSASSS